MRFIVPSALIVVGIIHLLPLTGVLGRAQLESLYGADISDPNLLLLMRHRAVLFGLLGAFLVYAAFTPALHAVALLMAAGSVVAFLGLAHPVDTHTPQVRRVVTADVVALALLVAAAVAHVWTRRSN
ncbi:phosphopantetheine adenylyltransferase [Comamonas sp. JC664]|uniref:phosphopantetheine adenylyltransferase n=1 Tax=Comamonas sp. JC664 TaxID=2801917 RepID=UPI00174844B7|nr:phosphopantetheine adenylyltransferase [Comamonas sp. JC664]MBL0698001.1 phosphopantetheine adenylyltransferase [Comamonas sp. JC664]GHG70763.1 hypothetical protein GCM10012319_16030 [Comamonas sp. KCTC 72670]